MLVCLECGKSFSMLQSHITRTHKITTQEYRDKHGQDTPFLSDAVLQKKRENGYSCWSLSDRVNKRGESLESAKAAIDEKRAVVFANHISTFNTDFWVERRGMTLEQAEFEVAARRGSKELLLRKYGDDEGSRRFDDQHKKIGFSNTKAEQLARGKTHEQIRYSHDNFTIQTLRQKYNLSAEDAAILRESRLENHSSNRTIKYWVERGYTQDEARSQISNIQRRDLTFFIMKYGEADGRIRYVNWVKAATSYSMGKFPSIESSKYFLPLIEWCDAVGYSYQKEKYVIIDTKSYYVDLVIPELMLAIEYDGAAFHANPLVVDEGWTSARGGYSYWDSILGDNLKTERLESLGYTVVRVHSTVKHKVNLIEIVKEHAKTIRTSRLP